MDRWLHVALRSAVVFFALMILTSTFAGAAALTPAQQNGVNWLAAQVGFDGSIANESAAMATPLQVREESAVSLALLAHAPGALVAGVRSNTDGNVEYTARRVINAANLKQTDDPDVASLLVAQNADGGWGLSPTYQSDPLDTALALQALHATNAPASVVTNGFAYLSQAELADGGWGATASSIYATANVLLAADAWSSQTANAAGIASSATAWLTNARGMSTDYGDTFDNAWALLALAAQSGASAQLSLLNTALTSAQLADGSWADDPYLTAVALRALWIASQPSPGQILVQGRVIDGQTGEALSGASVVLAGAQTYSLQTDANGQFVFANPAAGGYTLSVALTGFGTVTGSITTVAGQTLNLGTISLLPVSTGATNGTVKGIVSSAATGAPIAGATVTLNALSATTGSDGSYEIANVPAGQITVSAAASGYQTVTATGSLPAGGILLFSPQLTGSGGGISTTAVLSGIVTNANTHQPIAGATISVTGAALASAQTAADGSYQITGLAAGAVQITASAANYDSVVAATQFQSGATVTFSPALYPSGTSPTGANTSGISGTVVDASTNLALANVSIVATTPDGTTKTLATDAKGRFAVTGLTQAQVALNFTLTGYVPAQFTAWTVPLQTTDIGQVRLRATTANTLLPDLSAVGVDARSNTSRDPQTFQLSGTVQATISNIGTAPVSGAFNVLAFYDVDHNGKFDAGTDLVLGTARVTQSAAVGQSLSVSLAVSGTMPFRDAPVSVFVDSDNEIIELNEANNVVSSAASCGLTPHPSSAFTPRLKWAWSGSPVLPQYNQVMMAPAVARTHDTNGDGKIDQNDIPDVIFVAYGGNGADFGDGILRIISGKDGSDVAAVTDPNYRLTSYANIAVGDINGDGNVEIVGPKMGGGLVAFAHDGTPLWTLSYPVYGGWDFGAPAIVDLNGDGHPVIIAGGRVISGTGTLLWQASNGYIGGSHFAGSGGIAVDLNNDGHMAVLFGASAFSPTGQLLWQNSTVGDGIDAIGRFNPADPYPEIVVVGRAQVSLLDHTGKLIWGPVALPGGGIGGAPIVADLDGDGIPEIGVAGRSNYAVFGRDGSVRWTSTTHDYSSACTSSTVFDFFNDGRKEIAYSDEQYLRIYDGASGDILWQIQNSTGTAYELPVLADVDASGQASLLVVSNFYYGQYPGATNGIRAFTDQNNNWPGTRQIWNQLSYHISNVNDDGSIPQHETPSWSTHNTYRLNTKTNAFGLADLTAGRLQVVDNGAGQPLTLAARIGNAGMIASSATSVAFYYGDPGRGGALIGSVSLAPLAPSTYQDVQLTGVAPFSGSNDIYVVVDPANAIRECDKTNNVDSIAYTAGNLLATLSVATDAAVYGPNSPVQLTGNATNKGSFAVNLSVDLRIEDAAGNLVTGFGRQTLGAVNAGAAASSVQAWNTAVTAAGPYVLHGLLYRSDDGSLLAEARASFSITSNSPLATSTVHTDKGSYNASDTVQILSGVQSLSSNVTLSNATLNVAVFDASGASQFTHSYAVAQLLPSQTLSYQVPETLTNAAPGVYTVKQDLRDAQSNLLNHVETTYTVTSSSDTGFGLVGTIAATPKSLPVGATLTLTAAASNHGNAALTNLPLTITIVDPSTGTALQQFSQTSTVATGSTVPFNTSWITQGQTGVTYQAVLTATVGSGSSAKTLTLATDTFQLTIHLDATVTLSVGSPSLAALVLIDPSAVSGPMPARVTAALTALNYATTIVSTAQDFAGGVRSGAYQAYLLLGTQTQPDATTQRLLLEAVHRGEGLLSANGASTLPPSLAQALGLAASTTLPVINAQSIDIASTAPGGAAHVTLSPSLASRIVVPTTAQTQATLTGRLPSVPDQGTLSSEVAAQGRVDLGYYGSDAGTNGTHLALTSMGRLLNPDGTAAYTVWRIRNSGTAAASLTLAATDGTYRLAFTSPSQTDTYLASPDVAGTAAHQLVQGSQTIDTQTALTTTFGDTTPVEVGDNPGAIALWANRIGSTGVFAWSGAQHTLHGAIHSNSDLTLSGAQNLLDGPVHYVTAFSNSGSQNTFTFPPRQVATQPLPTLTNLNDYAPGGKVQQQAGANYYDETSECASKKTWSRHPNDMPLATGVYWIPCDVHLTGKGAGGTVTLVSTGEIAIDGSSGSFQPYYQGLQLATTASEASAIQLAGSGSQFGGWIYAPQGAVQISGSSMGFQCSIIADQIRLAGAKTQIDARQCAYATVQKQAPAVLWNGYGTGWAGYSAFDWQGAIGAYEATPGALTQLFDGTLAKIAPTSLALRSGSIVPLRLSVQNNGDAFTGQLGMAASDDSMFTPASWALSFSGKTVFTTTGTVRLGSGSGTVITATARAATPIVVDALSRATATVAHAPGDTLAGLIAAVQGISNPDTPLANALTALQAAQTSAAGGDSEGTLGHLLDAAADCAASANAQADALRTRIDWVIWAGTH